MSNDEHEDIRPWENPECPKKFDVEVYPPIGIGRIAPHHIRWWGRPFLCYRGWFWWRWCGCGHACCCCCSHERAAPREAACVIDARLAPNTFGQGRAIRILRTLNQFHAEFIIEWNASGTGQVTVDLDIVSGPGIAAPQRVASNKGPNDSHPVGVTAPGIYVFRATATTANGDTCFDTVTVAIPGF